MRDLIRRVKAFFGLLPQPDLTPGEWFRDYVAYWCSVHGIAVEDAAFFMTSGIVEGKNGWIWATNTPGLDRYWFESRGLAFPERWVVFDSLKDATGEPGAFLKLDI